MCACRAPWGWSQRERALLPEAGQPTPACDGDVIPAASASVEVPGPGSGRGRGGPGSRGGRWAHRGAQATGADSPGRSGALGACIPHLESGPWPPPAGWRRGCSERMSGVPTARERARWHARSIPGIRNVPQGATRYLARLHAAAQLPPRRRPPPPAPSPSSPPAARLQSVHEEASRASVLPKNSLTRAEVSRPGSCLPKPKPQALQRSLANPDGTVCFFLTQKEKETAKGFRQAPRNSQKALCSS